MVGLLCLLGIWSVVSVAILFDDLDCFLTPYGILGLLPGFLLIAPFALIYQIGKIIFGSNYGQIFHKFMSTPVKDLVKFRIKLERK